MTKISKNIIAQAESAWLLSLSEEQIVVFNVDQLCALANNNKIKFLGRHTFTDKSEKKILETIKSYWIDFTNVKLSKNKNANLKGNIAKKYKAIFNIINQLTLLNKDITQKWMKEIRIGLENALQDNYVISLDRESFVFSSIVGIVLAVIMANLSFFQFTGNTLIDITKGMAIFSINLGAILVSLFRGLLEKRKFIQKVMKEIDKGIP